MFLIWQNFREIKKIIEIENSKVTPADLSDMSSKDSKCLKMRRKTSEQARENITDIALENPNIQLDVNHIEVAADKLEDSDEFPDQPDESPKKRASFCFCC